MGHIHYVGLSRLYYSGVRLFYIVKVIIIERIDGVDCVEKKRKQINCLFFFLIVFFAMMRWGRRDLILSDLARNLETHVYTKCIKKR
jgi:hypothetical protein